MPVERTRRRGNGKDREKEKREKEKGYLFLFFSFSLFLENEHQRRNQDAAAESGGSAADVGQRPPFRRGCQTVADWGAVAGSAMRRPVDPGTGKLRLAQRRRRLARR